MEAETEGERLVDAKSTKQIGPDAAHYGPGHQIVGRTRAGKERKRASACHREKDEPHFLTRNTHR